MDGDNQAKHVGPESELSDWRAGTYQGAGSVSDDERPIGRERAAMRPFSPADNRRSEGRTIEEGGLPVYVEAAANVLDQIRKQHCLGRTPGSILREHIAQRGGSVEHLHGGRWRIMPCTSMDEAVDFKAYLIQRLKPLLNRVNSPWKRECDVLYDRFVQELYASEAVSCDELESKFVGAGVYVFYHTDKQFWQPAAEGKQGASLSEFGLLKKAIALSRAGDKRPAREILAHVISIDPRNELAWLWYAYNLERNPDRIRVLEECLRHNPECREAKDRLIYLQTSEALRLRVEEHRGEIETEIAHAEGRLMSLRESVSQAEQDMREAEEAYENAKDRVQGLRREIAQVMAELVQLREQSTDL